MNNIQETWKNIPRYEGLYKASTYGNIKSLITWGGTAERILKPGKDKDGYLQVQLCKNNLCKMKKVHRLVLETFIGPCPHNMQVCHNDGNPANNHLENLRYDTISNNHKDKTKHKTMYTGDHKGIKNSNAILNELQVRIIKRLLIDNYLTIKEIAKIFNVSKQIIYRIKSNKTWKHVKI